MSSNSSVQQVKPNDRSGDGVSTGLQAVDLVLDRLGWLRGHLNALTGPDPQTLTSVLLRTVAAAQERGERCAWVQAGGEIDPQDAIEAGVRLAELTVHRVKDGSPHGVVQALGKAIGARRKFGVVAVDSMPTPAGSGWKKATKAVDALAIALEGTGTACVYAMHVSEQDSVRHGIGRDLGAGYTRRLAHNTGVRIHLGASRSSLGRFRAVTAKRLVGGGIGATLGVDARGRVRTNRLTPEGLICLGFRTSVLTEPKPGLVAFGERPLGLDDGTAQLCLETDPRLARRLQKAIAVAYESSSGPDRPEG